MHSLTKDARRSAKTTRQLGIGVEQIRLLEQPWRGRL